MDGFIWAQPTGKPQAVIMTEEHARLLITTIVKEVSTKTDSDVLDMYKQLARLEVDLARARDEIEKRDSTYREEIERKNAEITALRAHIENIQRFMTAVPAAVAGQMPVPFTPYNNNGSQPWTPQGAPMYQMPFQTPSLAPAPLPSYQSDFFPVAPPAAPPVDQPPAGS